MSLGGPGYSHVMADAVDYALSHNAVVIAAIGNDCMAIKNYPASYPGVIAVGSTDALDRLSASSTLGTHISVTAPGDNIYSLSNLQNSGYLFKSGTSMSAPFVSGLAALRQRPFHEAAVLFTAFEQELEIGLIPVPYRFYPIVEIIRKPIRNPE